MSAQPLFTTVPNGVGVRDEPAPQVLTGESEPMRPKAATDTSGGQQRVPEVGSSVTALLESRSDDAGQSPVVLETAEATQAETEERAPTMPDLGGRSELQPSDPDRAAVEASLGFSTPRSFSGQRGAGQTAWLAGMDVPRWMSRLGSLLQVPGSGMMATDLAPSPFPAGSPGADAASWRTNLQVTISEPGESNTTSSYTTFVLLSAS